MLHENYTLNFTRAVPNYKAQTGVEDSTPKSAEYYFRTEDSGQL